MSAEKQTTRKKVVFKMVLFLLLALLLGGVTEYVTDNTLYRYMTGSCQQSMLPEDLVSNGYETTEGVSVSTKDDANFVGKVNKYVSCITLKLNEKAEKDLTVQIYYTSGREEFSEEKSLLFTMSAGESQESVAVGKKVKQIRIDIGNNAGDTFSLDKVVINDKSLMEAEQLGVSTLKMQNTGIRIFVYAMLFWFLLLHFLAGPRRLYDTLYRYRYAIGGGVVLFATVFELSGSSIGAMAERLGTVNETVWGTIRQIRSDEWALNTQMALSQCATGFHYFADAFRGTSTDMFMVYGQPVWALAEIFRPSHWGYLLFGAAKGLAFFWTARLVGLFLVSFEFGMLLSKKKRGLSFVYAMLLTFSSLVQWWVDVNGLVEMLLFAQLALLLFQKYLQSDRSRVRLVLAAGIAWCAGGFLLTLYPSWQVPVAYIILGCAVWLLMENWGSIRIVRKDIAGIAGVLVVFAGILYSVWIRSADTIKLVMESEYPGQRVLLGGSLDVLKSCFDYSASIFFPFTQEGLPMNVCEVAKMMDFFPLGNLLAVYVLVRSKKKDRLLCCIGVVDIILGLWCFFQWPEFLAKISLLSMSQAGRAVLAFEICNIILLIRSISLLAEEKAFSVMVSAIIALALAATAALITQNEMQDYMTTERTAIAAAVLFVVIFCLLQYRRFPKICTVFITALMVCAGLFVNPVQKGLGMIYDSELFQAIEGIEEKNPGKWLVEEDIFLSNLPTMAGASTVNSTNVYPNLEYWAKFDPDGKYEKIYNRYAWINAKIVDTKTKFKRIGPDQFQVQLGIDDLDEAGVDYVLTGTDLTKLDRDKFDLLYTDENYKIFAVAE